MKKILLATVIAFSFVVSASAQCEKKMTLNASKAIFLDPAGSEERVEESAITIEITKTSIHIKHGEGPNDQIDGSFKDMVCEWKEALKNGKSTAAKVDFTDAGGDTKPGKFSVEAKDGVITFWIELEEMQGRKIKVPVEKAKEE